MKGLLKSLIFFLMLTLLTAQEPVAPTPIQTLAEEIDAYETKASRQFIEDLPQTELLATAVSEDIFLRDGRETAQLLLRLTYEKPSWQIITREVLYPNNSDNRPMSERLNAYETIFLSTIRPNDHWVNYAGPMRRGWTDPFRFRNQLAKMIELIKTGKHPSLLVDQQLIFDDPKKWLIKHGTGRGLAVVATLGHPLHTEEGSIENSSPPLSAIHTETPKHNSVQNTANERMPSAVLVPTRSDYHEVADEPGAYAVEAIVTYTTIGAAIGLGFLLYRCRQRFPK
jgi:hypothetical protein